VEALVKGRARSKQRAAPWRLAGGRRRRAPCSGGAQRLRPVNGAAKTPLSRRWRDHDALAFPPASNQSSLAPPSLHLRPRTNHKNPFDPSSFFYGAPCFFLLLLWRCCFSLEARLVSAGLGSGMEEGKKLHLLSRHGRRGGAEGGSFFVRLQVSFILHSSSKSKGTHLHDPCLPSICRGLKHHLLLTNPSLRSFIHSQKSLEKNCN
jgi:hypothetical protein